MKYRNKKRQWSRGRKLSLFGDSSALEATDEMRVLSDRHVGRVPGDQDRVIWRPTLELQLLENALLSLTVG